jgi:AcrR family transcriptional regulator
MTPVSPTTAVPPARGRGRPRSAEAEQAILAATVTLLTERGIGGLSVEAVAARAGVAKTTIYRRWPAKEDLVVAAVASLKGDPPRLPGNSVRADLLALVRHISRRNAAGAWPALMTRLTIEAAQHPRLYAQAWQRTVGPRRQVVQDVLRRGIAEGSIRPAADLDLVTDVLVAPVVSRTRPGRRPLTDAQLVELVDTVLAGLRP